MHTYEAWIIKQEQNEDDKNEEDKVDEKLQEDAEKTISCVIQPIDDSCVEKSNEEVINKIVPEVEGFQCKRI